LDRDHFCSEYNASIAHLLKGLTCLGLEASEDYLRSLTLAKRKASSLFSLTDLLKGKKGHSKGGLAPVVGGVLSGVKDLLNDTSVTPLLGGLLEKTDNDKPIVSHKDAETELVDDTNQVVGTDGEVSLSGPASI
jgi:hypothetical protein